MCAVHAAILRIIHAMEDNNRCVRWKFRYFVSVNLSVRGCLTKIYEIICEAMCSIRNSVVLDKEGIIT